MEGDFNVQIQSLTSQSKTQPVEVKHLSAPISFSEIRNNFRCVKSTFICMGSSAKYRKQNNIKCIVLLICNSSPTMSLSQPVLVPILQFLEVEPIIALHSNVSSAKVTDLGVENTRRSLPRQQLDFFDPYKYGETVD